MPQDPKMFHQELGACLEFWQHVESALFMIFLRISLYSYVDWPMAIYTHIRAFDQKCVLIDKLAQHSLEGSPHLETWSQLLKKVTIAGKKRDKLVHYAIVSGDLERLIQPPLFDPRIWQQKIRKGDSEHYLNINELEKIKYLFFGLATDLGSFEGKIQGTTNRLRKRHAKDLLKRKARPSKKGSPPKSAKDSR